MTLPVGSTPPLEPGSGSAAVEVAALSRGALVRRRLLRSKPAVCGMVVLGLLFLLAFLGPQLTPYDYREQDYEAFLQPPSADHWFGTTQIGQDVFAQTTRGLQKSLIIGLLVAVLSTGLAAVVGATAGYLGGRVDRLLMLLVDLLLVIPSFLIIAIVSPAFRGASWLVLVGLLAAFQWLLTARIVRGTTLSLKEREFVLAARYSGASTREIIGRHLLPNMASLLVIDGTLNVGAAIIAETGLSYFGFGVQPPDVSLGTLIAAGTGSALTYPWLFLFSGGLLIATVLAVVVIGDGLRDALDPTSSRAVAR